MTAVGGEFLSFPRPPLTPPFQSPEEQSRRFHFKGRAGAGLPCPVVGPGQPRRRRCGGSCAALGGRSGTGRSGQVGVQPLADRRLRRVAGSAGTMSQDTEVDMKEVELNELEPEKQPMNAASGAAVVVSGGPEKNGLVKIKVADDEADAAAAKFTGLSKEELLKVAGSPGWVRTRWALLLLFWLGWLGMLAGAVVIIVQAPRCRELPAQSWWHKGALYRIGDLQAFQGRDAGDLASEFRAPPSPARRSPGFTGHCP